MKKIICSLLFLLVSSTVFAGENVSAPSLVVLEDLPGARHTIESVSLSSSGKWVAGLYETDWITLRRLPFFYSNGVFKTMDDGSNGYYHSFTYFADIDGSNCFSLKKSSDSKTVYYFVSQDGVANVVDRFKMNVKDYNAVCGSNFIEAYGEKRPKVEPVSGANGLVKKYGKYYYWNKHYEYSTMPQIDNLYQWDVKKGWRSLGRYNGDKYRASQVDIVSATADGEMLFGYAQDYKKPVQGGAFFKKLPIVWTEKTGFYTLPGLSGSTDATIMQASKDGRIIIGSARDEIKNPIAKIFATGDEYHVIWVDGAAPEKFLEYARRAGVKVPPEFEQSTFPLVSQFEMDDSGQVFLGKLTNGKHFVINIPRK